MGDKSERRFFWALVVLFAVSCVLATFRKRPPTDAEKEAAAEAAMVATVISAS